MRTGGGTGGSRSLQLGGSAIRGATEAMVAYAYDTQGRMTCLSTWQDFAAQSGRADTRWTYDTRRGWLADAPPALRARLLAAGDSGTAGIVPGKPEASHLLSQITPGVDGKSEMPSEFELNHIRTKRS